MPLISGETAIGKIRKGEADIARAYMGETLVFSDYAPQGVVFDGGDRLARAGGLSGASDSNKFTLSAWLKVSSDSSTRYVMAISSGFSVSRRSTGNEIEVFGAGGGATRLSARTTGSALTVADGWRHVLMSFDLSDTAKRKIYVDDSSQALTVTTYSNSNIAFSAPAATVGSSYIATGLYTGSMCDLWFQPGLYLDLTDEDNRRKFISATGKPVWLGADGSRPTGAQPLVYLGGRTTQAAGWHLNNGTGGDFTVAAGALTQDTTTVSVAT